MNQRHAAETALRDLNQTLEQRVAERTADRDRMWRLSNDVMLVARPDGTITSTNPAWKQLLGWNEATLLGAPLHDFVGADGPAQAGGPAGGDVAQPVEPFVRDRHADAQWRDAAGRLERNRGGRILCRRSAAT